MKLTTKYQVKTRADRKIQHRYVFPQSKKKSSIISKTKVKRHMAMKTHPHLQLAIRAALKNKSWLALAKKLAGSTRLHPALNLQDIEEKTTAGDTVVIPGKVLSLGELSKKVRIASLSISASAKDKLKKTKSDWIPLYQEIQSNPKAEGIKVLS